MISLSKNVWVKVFSFTFFVLIHHEQSVMCVTLFVGVGTGIGMRVRIGTSTGTEIRIRVAIGTRIGTGQEQKCKLG